MGAVEADDAGRREQLGDGAGEGRGDRRLRPVMPSQPIEGLVSELGRRQARAERVERGGDTLAERLAVHRGERRVGRARRQRRGHEGAVRRQPRRVARLREIVIVARDPEDRHHRARPLSLQHPGERRRGERLVHGVQRPGEEPGLLTAGHRERARLRAAGPARPPAPVTARRPREAPGRSPPSRGSGRTRERVEWRGYEAEAHGSRPARMVRGESGLSGAAS